MIEGFSILRTYSYAHEAHLDLAKLTDENIEAELIDEQISSVYPGIGYAVGVKLIVPTNLLDKAREILDRNESDSLNTLDQN